MIDMANIPNDIEIPIENIIETPDATYLKLNVIDEMLSVLFSTSDQIENNQFIEKIYALLKNLGTQFKCKMPGSFTVTYKDNFEVEVPKSLSSTAMR